MIALKLDFYMAQNSFRTAKKDIGDDVLTVIVDLFVKDIDSTKTE